MKHPSTENILAYVSGHLPEGESYRLEMHLADCDACAEKAHQYYLIRSDFEKTWSSLSARTLAENLLEIRLAEMLSGLEDKPDLLDRAKSWLRHFYYKTQIIMSITVNISKNLVEILEEGFSDINRFAHLPAFIPVGQEIRALGEGSPDNIKHQERRGPKGEQVDIYYSDDLIQLKIVPLSFKRPLPLIWFLSPKTGQSHLIETHHPAETNYLIAEFSTNELLDLNNYTIFLQEQ